VNIPRRPTSSVLVASLLLLHLATLVPAAAATGRQLTERFDDGLQSTWLMVLPAPGERCDYPPISACMVEAGKEPCARFVGLGSEAAASLADRPGRRVFFLGQERWGDLVAFSTKLDSRDRHGVIVGTAEADGFSLVQHGDGTPAPDTWIVVIPGFGPTRMQPATEPCRVLKSYPDVVFVQTAGQNPPPILRTRHTTFWQAYLVVVTADGRCAAVPAYVQSESTASVVFEVPRPTGSGL